ncbi:hypothetical protein [uncultured Tateyamaria sp.]|uniref:hypothetical protein n=1 Tax=uncultured Tateyamaria sp. TaxID=455651 RepID=UPI002612F0CB|nr:hypothetical protein [uncultured Tateyamaria sp.]
MPATLVCRAFFRLKRNQAATPAHSPVAVTDPDANGGDVFSASRPIIFKRFRVKHIFDQRNDALNDAARGRETLRSSAKVSLYSATAVN